MMNKVILVIGAFFLMSFASKTGKQAITLYNGKMTRRGCDKEPFAGGCGHFGASRGTRKHEGIDILCEVGGEVYAPFDGYVERKVTPYAGWSFSGLQINHGDFTTKIMYFLPVDGLENTQVVKGQIIGYCQDIQKKYGSSVPRHLHVEIIDNDGVHVDPEKYLF